MFIPLHLKSDYSLGYGTSSVDELVECAAASGYPTLALTDLENLYGQVRFHDRCRRHGIKPISGVELRPGFHGRLSPGRREGRVLLLALDHSGFAVCAALSLRGAALRGPGLRGTRCRSRCSMQRASLH